MLTERQQALLEQVQAGKVTEQLPDTTVQLLTLARLGLIVATDTDTGWRFAPIAAEKPKRTRAKKG